ncbi:MAG: hypothetical protein AB4080_03835 [Trichodesmium sp.]
MTVFPISFSQNGNVNLEPELTLDGNAPDLPISSDFSGIGEAEKLVYEPLVSDTDYTTVVTSVNGTTGLYLLEFSSEDSSNDFSNTAVSISYDQNFKYYSSRIFRFSLGLGGFGDQTPTIQNNKIPRIVLTLGYYI